MRVPLPSLLRWMVVSLCKQPGRTRAARMEAAARRENGERRAPPRR
jgi:hypothetical protein